MGKEYILRQKNSGRVERYNDQEGEKQLRTYPNHYDVIQSPDTGAQKGSEGTKKTGKKKKGGSG